MFPGGAVNMREAKIYIKQNHTELGTGWGGSSLIWGGSLPLLGGVKISL